MSILFFVFWLLILTTEGFFVAQLLLRNNNRALDLSLSLPIASLLNVIVVFMFTVLQVPLTFISLAIAHIILSGGLYVKQRMLTQHIQSEDAHIAHNDFGKFRIPVRILCAVLLSLQAFFSFTHAVILPTYQIDSLTNWTMRSKVSFYDQKIAFDPTEVRGVAKPQYPILFHALQITVNQGNTDWSDRSANSILFLLSASSLAALFLIVKKRKGSDWALLTLTLLLSIPLLSFHLAEGYADIVLVQYLLLMIACLWRWKADDNLRWLMFSGLFAACATWTKSEGLIIGLFLWILFFGYEWIRSAKKPSYAFALLTLILALPYPIFLLVQGMGLTPHSSDTSFGWHGDAFATALSGLFTSGSMGVVWWAILVASILILVSYFKRIPVIEHSSLRLGWIGALTLLIILITYIFTPNAVFLANGESYFRQLMIPASELILWCMLVLKKPSSLS